MELYTAKPGYITPVAAIGQNLVVLYLGKYTLHTVLFREGISPSNPLVRNFGAIVAGATSNQVSLQALLEQEEDELFQIRMVVLDDIRLTLRQPLSTGRATMKNVWATITPFSNLYDPCGHLTEMAVYGVNAFPFMDVNNPTQYNLAQTRVLFYGFKYRLEKQADYATIQSISVPYSAIVAEGMVR